MSSAAVKSKTDLRSLRDTVESVWMAIVLAFVLRAFMIEGFVIPTGSMAPDLLGEHWDLQCSACGLDYAYGWSHAGRQPVSPNRSATYVPPGASCPNCNRPYHDGPLHVNGGDRVLVLKYLYRFAEPAPWDVIVFRNPQSNRDNYIKRLIGLPGETIEIVHGDIFVAPSPDGPFHIRRKPPKVQEAMWQIVYDNDYQPDPTWRQSQDCPKWRAADGASRWDLSGDGGRRFSFAGGPAGRLIFQAPPRSFLPTYGYNSRRGGNAFNIQRDICTDLNLGLVFIPRGPDASVELILSGLGHRFKARLSADGKAQLFHQATDWSAERWDLWESVELGELKIGQGYRVALSHVDLSVFMTFNGRVIIREEDRYPETYASLKERVLQSHVRPIRLPQAEIAAAGGPCELLHIRLRRDVFYTDQSLAPLSRAGNPLGDYARRLGISTNGPGWGVTGHPITLARNPDNPDLDEFFVLGDNSPQSLDGRSWTAAAPTLRLFDSSGRPIYHVGTVPRYNLIGKAFFVYWPAGFRPPLFRGLPLIPNVGRMRMIR